MPVKTLYIQMTQPSTQLATLLTLSKQTSKSLRRPAYTSCVETGNLHAYMFIEVGRRAKLMPIDVYYKRAGK